MRISSKDRVSLASNRNNMVSRSNARYHAVQLGRKNVHVVRLLLRSIGLKILTLQRKIGANYIGDSSEQEQILVDVSKKIASSRIAVHLLPVAFTICLFLMNGIEILNEPQITTPSTFFQQVAAKLHVSTPLTKLCQQSNCCLTMMLTVLLRNSLSRQV